MNNIKVNISRLVVSALFTAVLAGTWDVWWHSALGRESSFSPPHLLLYTAVSVAIIAGVYGWHKTREKMWKRLAIFLSIVPISAPFDELWHRVFGIETLSSPLIVWSPPHVLLVLAIVGSLGMLLPILKKEEDSATRNFFGAMCFAAIFTLLLFLMSPLDPIGPYHLLGFWGIGFSSLVFVWTLLAVKKWMPGVGTGILFVAFVCLLISIGAGEQSVAKGIKIPHAHMPSWLQIFALIVPALAMDFLRKKSVWLMGGLAGLLYGGIMYTFAREFIEPAFQYSTTSLFVAIVASVVGGVVASAITLVGHDKFPMKK